MKNESFQQFTTELKLLLKNWGYIDQDEMVRDCIAIGCKAKKVRERTVRLNMQGQTSLPKAMEIGVTIDMSQTQMKTLADEDPKVQGN